MFRSIFVFSCTCVLLDTLSAASVAAQKVPDALVGVWLAEDIGGRGVIDNLQTTLEINADGTYAGLAGCNRYTGTLSFQGETLVFGPAASTRKMCVPAAMDQERRFFEALKTGLSWKKDGSKLDLSKPDASMAVRFVAHARSADIILSIPGATAVERRTLRYNCGGTDVVVEYVNAGTVSLAALTIGNEFVVAANVVSGSGAKYAGGSYVWWTKGDEATLIDATRDPDGPGTLCKTVQ